MTTYTSIQTTDKHLIGLKGSAGPFVKQKISQPRETMRTVQHLMTFGDSDAAVFCAKFDA